MRERGKWRKALVLAGFEARARHAHNPKVAGSNPAPATNGMNDLRPPTRWPLLFGKADYGEMISISDFIASVLTRSSPGGYASGSDGDTISIRSEHTRAEEDQRATRVVEPGCPEEPVKPRLALVDRFRPIRRSRVCG